MNSYIHTDTHLILAFNNGSKTATITTDHPDYPVVIAALQSNDWDELERIAFPVKSIEDNIIQYNITDRVQIKDGVVLYDGQPVHSSLTRRMLFLARRGISILSLSKFLANLMENPSNNAVTRLYDFLEASSLPITEDGHFLAYKRVTEDFKDIFSGKYDNSVGAVCEMPRHAVDENGHNTCSTGLHFCALSYLPHYGAKNGGKVVVVKINPRDVVAIPVDYSDAKGRTCRYEVIKELPLVSTSHTALPAEQIPDLYTSAYYTNTLSDGDRESYRFEPQCDDGDGKDEFYVIDIAGKVYTLDEYNHTCS